MKQRLFKYALACALGLLSMPAAAASLRPPEARQGYYVSLGSLAWAAQLSGDAAEGVGTQPGFGLSLRLGEMLTPRFGLGLQMMGGQGGSTGYASQVGGLLVTTQWQWNERWAAHFGAGLGFSSLKEDRQNAKREGAAGGYYSAGITYDWFPFDDGSSGGLSVTPSLYVQAIPSGDMSSFVAWGGVELAWWSGLPRNQLLLDANEAFSKE